MSGESKQQVIIIAGPNGAGKSTLAPALLRDTFGLMEYVNADTIAQGLSAFQPELAAFEAGRIMLKRLHSLARQKATFAFESTLSGATYISWLRNLLQQGYEFHLLFLWLQSPDLAIQRVRERVKRGGHDVPEEVIRRRYQSGLRNFFQSYRSLTATWGFYDNSQSFSPQVVATGGSKQSTTIYQQDLWYRICEGLQ